MGLLLRTVSVGSEHAILRYCGGEHHPSLHGCVLRIRLRAAEWPSSPSPLPALAASLGTFARAPLAPVRLDPWLAAQLRDAIRRRVDPPDSVAAATVVFGAAFASPPIMLS